MTSWDFVWEFMVTSWDFVWEFMVTSWDLSWDLSWVFTRPGKHTQNNGKSPCLMGKSTLINYKLPFSLANCEITRGFFELGISMFFLILETS